MHEELKSDWLCYIHILQFFIIWFLGWVTFHVETVLIIGLLVLYPVQGKICGFWFDQVEGISIVDGFYYLRFLVNILLCGISHENKTVLFTWLLIVIIPCWWQTVVNHLTKLNCERCSGHLLLKNIKSLWANDAKWRHRTNLTFVQVMGPLSGCTKPLLETMWI